MIKRIITLFLVAVVVSMIVMQPLQVANAQLPAHAGKNDISVLCKIVVALPFYAVEIKDLKSGDDSKKIKSAKIVGFVADVVVDHNLLDIILEILGGLLLIYQLLHGQFSALLSPIIRAATTFLMTTCPPIIKDSDKSIFDFPDQVIGLEERDAPGNPNYRTTPTDFKLQCTAAVRLSLSALEEPLANDDNHFIRFFKNEWGDLDHHPETIYPPEYDLSLEPTVVWENNIRDVAFSHEPNPNFQGFDIVRFKVGETQIHYRAHQFIADHLGTSSFTSQAIRVTEPVLPSVEAGNPIILEAIEPGGIPIPIGILDKIKKTLTFLGDDCTPNDKLRFNLKPPETVRKNFMPFGIHNFTLSVTDQSGNTSEEIIVKVEVQDTIPPDIFPVHNIGITVLPGVSQIDSSQVPLTAPLTFDFGTLEPNLTCTVNNSLDSGVPCDSAFYPVGTSTVTWTSTDFSGNSAEELVLVIVKTEGTNTAPVANDKTINVLPDQPNEIEISGSDVDFDPLVFSIVDNPQNGFLETDIEAIFQTKFSIAGIIPKMTTHFELRNVDDNRFLIIPDPINRRILLTTGSSSEVFVNDARTVPDFDGLPFSPDSIVPKDGSKSTGATGGNEFSIFDNFIMADWNRSLLRISGLDTNNPPPGQLIGGTFVPINTPLVNPQNMENNPVAGNEGLYITDLKDGGRVVKIDYNGNFVTEWNLDTLGITPDGIARAPDRFADFIGKEFYVTDWPNKRILHLKLDDNTDQCGQNRICILHEIDMSSGFSNPPRFPDLISPRDILVQVVFNSFFGKDFLVIKTTEDFHKSTMFSSVDLSSSPITAQVSPDNEIGKSFREIVMLATDSSGRFYTWDGNDVPEVSINVFELSGRLINRIGLESSDHPKEIGADSSGNLFVISDIGGEPNSDTLRKFSPNGDQVEVLRFEDIRNQHDLFTMNQLVVDNDNKVHLAFNDFNDNIVIRQYDNDLTFNAFTEIVTTVKRTTNNLGDLAIDSQGNYYLLELPVFPDHDGRLLKIDSNGNLVKEFHSVNFEQCTGFTNPSVTVDVDDNVYVSDCVLSPKSPRIQLFSPDGDLLGTALAEGVLDDFVSFLDKGDFIKINGIGSTGGLFFVAEGEKVIDGVLLGKRLHVFEPRTLEPIADGIMRTTYTPDPGFLEEDGFTFQVNDLFADSNVAQVTINVAPDTTPPNIVLKPNSQTFFDNLFLMEYSDNGETYTNEHFLKPMAYQIVKKYTEIYEQNTGEKIPEEMIETLRLSALKIAKRDAMGISDVAQNVKLEQKDSLFYSEMISEPYLISDTGKITNLDGTLRKIPQEFNLALYTYEKDYQDGFVTVPARISFHENSCFPSVTIESESVWGVPKTNSVLDAVFNLISAEDEHDKNPTITNNAPDFLQTGPNVITITATDESGNSASCTWEVNVVDTIFPSITSPPTASTKVTGFLTQLSDLGIPTVSDGSPDETVSLIPNGNVQSLGPVLDDLWDVSNNISVTGSSLNHPLFDELDLFGASTTSSAEPGHFVFADLQPTGTSHFVEWETQNPITLRSFALFAQHDGDLARSFSSFKLYAFDDNTANFELISSFNPVLPYQNNPDSSDGTLRVIQNIVPVTASKFRAEFVQDDESRNQFGDEVGPRIIELDGFDSYFQNCTQGNDNITCSLLGIENSDITVSNDSPGEFEVGITPITWTATDFSGNSATSEQDVSITDDTPPTIEPHDDIQMDAINGYSNLLDYEIPMANDVGGILRQTECTPAPGDEIPMGVTPIFCSAMDNLPNVGIRTFSAFVQSPDDDQDNIVKIVDTDDTLFSNEFSDESLLGITFGKIMERGEQNLSVIDAPLEELGVTVSAEPTSLGINDDLDCKDNTTNEIFFGDPSDVFEDECYDSEGNLKSGVTETIDEDPIDGIDNDGDGFVDEDPDNEFGPTPAEISVCDDSALILLGDGDAVNVTCGSVTIQIVSGTITVEFTTGGDPATITLGDGDEITYDPDTFSLTAGPDTEALIIIGDQSIPITGGETIQLDVDEEPPTIDTPADITVPTDSGVSTAVVDYSDPPADDNVGVTDVSCIPPSGSTFPLSTTTVDCTASDAAGNTADASFTVTVVDEEPPELTTPDDITVDAEDPFGTLITYLVSATDNAEPPPTISCSPESGTVFSIGTTTVDCTATDAADNQSTDSFDVTVQLSLSTFDGFIAKIESLGIQKGIENSLISKIDAAAKSFDKGKSKTATNQLEAFINEVDAQDGKKLDSDTAAMLRDAANLLLANL